MKRKVFILLIIILMVLLGYKAAYYIFYMKISENLKNRLVINDTMIINLKQINDEYLEFKNIKIRNDFNKFTLLDSTSLNISRYILKDNNETIASFWFGTSDTMFIDQIKNADKSLFGTNSNKKAVMKLIETNNINDDIELFKFINTYLDNHKNDKYNLFTSVKKLKESYSVNVIASEVFSNSNSITLIDGGYNGYMFNYNNNIKEVYIIKNDKRYVFTFVNNEYFTDAYIKDLLETVVIL